MKRLLLPALLLAVSCKTAETPEPGAASPAPVPAPAEVDKVPAPKPLAEKPMPPGIDLSIIDAKTEPCVDFYRYACGGWLDNTPIPADRERYSRGFIAIAERNEKILRELLEAVPPGAAYGQQLSDYYATCNDEAALEKSLDAAKAELKKLDAIKTHDDLARAIGRWHARGLWPLFKFDSAQDFADATKVIGNLDQGGLGLPDREYYLKDDEKMKGLRAAYVELATSYFTLYGQKPEEAKKSAEKILAFETALAKASLDKVSRRDPKNVYHRLERAGVIKTAPSFKWPVYFAEVGQKDVQEINVTHPPFFEHVEAVVKGSKPADWKTYLTWVYLRSMGETLPKAFRDEGFKFTARLTGAKEDKPRWKKCVGFTDRAMGEALGKMFVDKTFGGDSKQVTLDLVRRIEKAFEANTGSLAWMDKETQGKALEKARKMANKIGYPDAWRDYSALKTDRSSFASNVLAANAFEVKRQLDKIGKPLDRGEWLMSPPAVNAYNEGSMNEIVFPAGILQPPFFQREAAMPVNFGSMGMVVGHELTHGFDDQGRKFDANGNLKDWWSKASGEDFERRASCVKRQFDGFTAIDEVHVNGALTLGENVADLGGIKLAHAAMTEWVAETKFPADQYRLTPSQMFYVGIAQAWCTSMRPEAARMLAQIDPHSPPKNRVNGPLSNLPSFAAAFGCREGQPMAAPAKDRCEVW